MSTQQIARDAEQQSSAKSIELEQMGEVTKPRRAMMDRLAGVFKGDLLPNIVSLLAFLTIWEIGSRLANSPFIPGAWSAVEAAGRLWRDGDVHQVSLLSHIFASTGRVLSGFALGVITAVPLGLLMGLMPRLYRGTRSIFEPIRFIPPLAWIPMAIVLLSGYSRYVFIIWIGVFFIVWINTLVAVPNIDQIYFNVIRVHGASWWYMIRRVVLPGTLPNILAGMRIGLGAAWMCIVAAEMIGGEVVGLGKLLIKYAELMKMPEIVVGMVIIGILGFVMNDILLYIGKRLFVYRQEQRG
jgi:ABC-type nitrate/sulfonate/bicarbonate transport system permease component